MATRERNAQEMLSRVERDPRRRFGWGPSDLASPEEKAAYEYLEKRPLVESGQMSPAALPEEYGGRPTGSTRRSMRMQAAWDAQYKSELERQKEIRDAERFNLEIAREQRFRDQEDREFVKQKLLSDRENAIQQEARFIQDSIIGGQQIGVDKEGNPVFSKPINVRDKDAVESLQRLSKNRLGMKDQAAYDMWKTALDDAREYREEMEGDAIEARDKNLSFIVERQKEASSLGVDVSPYFTQDEQTGEVTAVDQIGLSEAIGKAKKEDIENKKQKITASKLDEDTRKQAASIIGQIEDTDKLIREANFKARGETSKKNADEYLSQAEFLRSERALLEQRFNNVFPQKEKTQQGQSQKEISQRDQAALNWANANPDDPRAKKIKDKLGVQ
jgi:hypothetical protein